MPSPGKSGKARLVVANSSKASIQIGIEPIGMFLDVREGAAITVEFDRTTAEVVEVVRWDGGISVWLLGSVRVYDDAGTMIGNF